MARPKFLPDKSGDYIVEYGHGLARKKERVSFDKKKGIWLGTKEDAFYKAEILSWYDAKYETQK